MTCSTTIRSSRVAFHLALSHYGYICTAGVEFTKMILPSPLESRIDEIGFGPVALIIFPVSQYHMIAFAEAGGGQHPSGTDCRAIVCLPRLKSFDHIAGLFLVMLQIHSSQSFSAGSRARCSYSVGFLSELRHDVNVPRHPKHYQPSRQLLFPSCLRPPDPSLRFHWAPAILLARIGGFPP